MLSVKQKLMRLRQICGALVAGWLASQALAADEAIPVQPVLDVSFEQLSEFWDLDDALQGQSKPRFRKNIQYGCVRVAFTINAEGSVFEPTILKSVPAKQFDAFVLETLADIEADVADNNPEQKAVRTQHILVLTRADGDTEIIDNPGIAKLCQ